MLAKEETMFVWHDSLGEVESIDVQAGEPLWQTANRFASSYHRLGRNGRIIHVLGINARLSQEQAIMYARSYVEHPERWLNVDLGNW